MTFHRPDPIPDPLADPAEPTGPPPCGDRDCRPSCPCGKCHGYGWVPVGRGYVTRRVPDPPADVLAGLSDDEAAAFTATLEAQRVAAARSVYPCRFCRPAMFARWVGGHLAPDHTTAECAECCAVYGRRAPSRLAGAGASS